MKRINLRDVPDDVYSSVAAAAASNRQSLNAYVLERLAEMARAARIGEYLSGYRAPDATGISSDDVVDAVRHVREAS